MAGVMLRERLTAGARHAFAYVSPGGGAGMLFRSVAGTDALPGEPRRESTRRFILVEDRS